MADVRPVLENQSPDKHVEDVWRICLDQGSTPCSSTEVKQCHSVIFKWHCYWHSENGIYSWLPLSIFTMLIMISYEQQSKLQDIVRGAILEGQKDSCTTVRNLLCQSFGSDPTIKTEFQSRSVIKEEQAEFLKAYAYRNHLLLNALPTDCKYLTRGGEAEIYLAADNRHVIKVNDAIYYASWMEYFNSIVIHNLLFPNTAYLLIGFIENTDGNFCVVLEQIHVTGGVAELDRIKELLTFNGFVNLKRQDYSHNKFDLILEDMHDENVIVKDDVLFFIDTVFYIMGSKIRV